MKLETWVSIAALGLSAMFVVLLISFYNFLIGPDGKGPQEVVDTNGVLGELISISGLPAIVLAGICIGLAKTYGSRSSGIILTLAGVLGIAGMLFALNLVSRISTAFFVGTVVVLPYVFIAAATGILGIGIYLFARGMKRVKNLDDLR